LDLALAIAFGIVEGKAGQTGGEAEEPVVPGLTMTGVPRRYPYDLERLEGVDRAHVVVVHCQDNAPELIDRLKFDPKVKDVSTFPDVGTAQKGIQTAIDAEQERIGTWLKAGEPVFLDPPIQMDTGGDVGRC
jgi:hypothetical protein